jgi:dTDP-4-amino-4,6-dideoxygalactose transaminase
MVVTSSEDLERRVRYLSVFGMKAAWEREGSREYQVPEFHDVGYNYKLSDILAAVGLVQMRKIETVLKKKAALAKYYDEMLEGMDWIRGPSVAGFARHAYQSYVAVVSGGVNRNRLISRLKERGIQAQIGTYSCHVQPVYKSKQKCPVSRMLSESTIALPFYPTMKMEEIDDVVKALARVKDGST